MEKRIPLPKMKDFLLDYMKPYHLSAYKLAKLINVPVSRIQDILHDRRKMSIDTSMRLGKLFGIDGLFFFRLQLDIDYRKAKLDAEMELEKIQELEKKSHKYSKVEKDMQKELDSIPAISAVK